MNFTNFTNLTKDKLIVLMRDAHVGYFPANDSLNITPSHSFFVVTNRPLDIIIFMAVYFIFIFAAVMWYRLLKLWSVKDDGRKDRKDTISANEENGTGNEGSTERDTSAE